MYTESAPLFEFVKEGKVKVTEYLYTWDLLYF